jgi:hypothetical protein
MSVPPVARLTKNQLDRRNVWSGTYELISYYRQHQRGLEVSNKKVQRISGMSQFSPVSLKRFSKHSGMMSMFCRLLESVRDLNGSTKIACVKPFLDTPKIRRKTFT